MAFVFVPNADGGFDEGMRQTNPETEVEYIYTEGAWRPLGPKIEDEFDTLDDRYLRLTGGTLTDRLFFDRGASATNMVISPNAGDTSSSIYALNGGFIRLRSSLTDDLNNNVNTHISFGKNPDTDEPQTNIYHVQYPTEANWAANKQYVDNVASTYLPLSGGTLTGTTRINGASFFVNNADGDEVIRLQETGFIRSLDMVRVQREGSGPAFQARIGTEANAEIRTEGSAFFKGNVNMHSNKIINVALPTSGTDAANKTYVDQTVGAINLGGLGAVPVGAIMMWINGPAPQGWFKLKGADFDINAYPLLHAYLQQSEGYVSGKLPDWRGHYPGQLGDHLNGTVGIKLPQQTAKPSGGSPKSSRSIPNNNTRTFTATGNTNAYSNGVSPVTIDTGWDDVTRPKTVAVHFIIKHD